MHNDTVKRLLMEARHLAMESLSDDDVPAPIERLAALASIDTGVAVHAIKRGAALTYEPGAPVADRIGWHARRLCRTPRPDDPPAVERRRPCWHLIVDGSADRGNPVTLAEWFADHDIPAAAINPTCCEIVTAGPVGAGGECLG